MTLLASIFMLALTRAEIIERMRAAPVTRVDGLVQVVASCPADMRREFQMPVATFAGDVCLGLYRGLNERPRHFADPGIVIVLGDVRTNDTRVIVRQAKRVAGGAYSRILLPSPAFADTARLRLEVAKAFYRSVRGRELSDADAGRALLRSDPEARIADDYASLRRWRSEGGAPADDERMLQLSRKVLQPGVTRRDDVLRFASRLYLYPECHGLPFVGGITECPFADAVSLAGADAQIRAAARIKIQEMIAYGMGRSRELAAASAAYAAFLAELAEGVRKEEDLMNLLSAADRLLEHAMNKAQDGSEGEDE